MNLLTTADVAQRLGVSLARVRQLIQDGTISTAAAITANSAKRPTITYLFSEQEVERVFALREAKTA